MTFLLDTHYLIWAFADTGKISKKVKDIITEPENRIIVSTISFWEISLKSALGKLEISGFSPADLPGLCAQMNFDIEPLSARVSSTYHCLKADHHKDPFDRMLIWQAISNNYILISNDVHVNKYASERLQVLS